MPFFRQLSLSFALLCVLLLASPAQANHGFSDDFHGLGLGAELHHDGDEGALGLFLTGRTGEFGFIGWGLATDLGYHLGVDDLVGRLGADAFLAFFGLRLDAAWRAGLGAESEPDIGLAYRLEFLIPTPMPILLHLGGESLARAGTEFVTGASICFALDGRSLRW